MTDSMSVRYLLMASAEGLRHGVADESNASALEALAAALAAPNGFIVKVGGAAFRYDLCAGNESKAHAAAARAGLLRDEYTVEPFLALRQSN